MYTKKSYVDMPLFASENEFRILLTIQHDIKKVIFKMFPHIKVQIIETLFKILSSQALLYDQIIRKSVVLQGSLTKQTQITKLVQDNRSTFEKRIQEHLNSFNTTYDCPLSEPKSDIFHSSISKGRLSNMNNSGEDSIHLDQESICSNLRKKIKTVKPQHWRTNSAGTTTNKVKHEETKQKDVPKFQKEKIKEKKSILKKSILSTKNKVEPKYKKIQLRFDKTNESNQTPENLYQSQQNRSAWTSLSELKCLTERRNSDEEFEDEKINHFSSFHSLPLTEEIEYRRIGSKPTKYTRHLLRKYQDVVNSYEKFETEEDENQKYGGFSRKITSRTDLKKKNSDIETENLLRGFIITDSNNSKVKNKPKIKNRNISCGQSSNKGFRK